MIRRTTWVVLALFVVLIGVYWFIQRQNKTKAQATTPTPSSQPVFVTGFETVQAVRLEDSSGKIVAIEKDSQGNWSLTEPEAEAADQDKASTMASQVSNFRSLAIIDNPPALDAVGLATPAYTVTVDTVDGSQQIATIGSLTPTSSGYYVESDGGPMMVVAKTAVDGFLANLDNPPIAPTPTVEITPDLTEAAPEISGTPTP